ncbi:MULTISPECIES: hypothetical protein [unclassified Luteococcus]|uniref:hypothetical protein n=1 Tax=unclassified Luteococcus TaxID=2639923 RepID=UPI00313EE793
MSRRQLAHALLILAGLGLMAFGIWRVASPDVTCRGVPMGPGDVCHKNDFSKLGSEQVQSYEERRHAARLSQPVVIVLGAGVAAFGTALLAADRRRSQPAA